jgi:hypothetical protein
MVEQPPGTLQGGVFIKKVASPYTDAQIAQYLKAVGYLGTNEIADDVVKNHQTSLENLTRLMRQHLVSFPFENSPMH